MHVFYHHRRGSNTENYVSAWTVLKATTKQKKQNLFRIEKLAYLKNINYYYISAYA